MSKSPTSDLKNQLGSLVRATVQQLETVRDAVAKKGREGRVQLELTLLRRRRRAALADLGDAVAHLIARGQLAEDAHPELSQPIARLEAIDEQIAREERRMREDAVRSSGDWSPVDASPGAIDEKEDAPPLDDLEDEDLEGPEGGHHDDLEPPAKPRGRR
jgi:hypothetical protein